jgi:hypothetical protein
MKHSANKGKPIKKLVVLKMLYFHGITGHIKRGIREDIVLSLMPLSL